jgi:hypothetical protein
MNLNAGQRETRNWYISRCSARGNNMGDKKRKMICAGHDKCPYGAGHDKWLYVPKKERLTDHCGIHDEDGACKNKCPLELAPAVRCRPATDEEMVYFKMLHPES